MQPFGLLISGRRIKRCLFFLLTLFRLNKGMCQLKDLLSNNKLIMITNADYKIYDLNYDFYKILSNY